MYALPIIQVPQTNAVQGAYIPDTTGPRLEGFIELNYLTNTLTLQLSETVNVNTLNFSALSQCHARCHDLIVRKSQQQQHSCSSIVVSPVLQEMDNSWIIV